MALQRPCRGPATLLTPRHSTVREHEEINELRAEEKSHCTRRHRRQRRRARRGTLRLILWQQLRLWPGPHHIPGHGRPLAWRAHALPHLIHAVSGRGGEHGGGAGAGQRAQCSAHAGRRLLAGRLALWPGFWTGGLRCTAAASASGYSSRGAICRKSGMAHSNRLWASRFCAWCQDHAACRCCSLPVRALIAQP